MIVIATDRPIGFWEATTAAAIVRLSVHRDPDESRIGGNTDRARISYATQIIAHDNNVIELEDFATQPIMLNNIRAEAKE